jgi:hypothetical protein
MKTPGTVNVVRGYKMDIIRHNQFTAGLSRFGPAGTPSLVS